MNFFRSAISARFIAAQIYPSCRETCFNFYYFNSLSREQKNCSNIFTHFSWKNFRWIAQHKKRCLWWNFSIPPQCVTFRWIHLSKHIDTLCLNNFTQNPLDYTKISSSSLRLLASLQREGRKRRKTHIYANIICLFSCYLRKGMWYKALSFMCS